MTARAAGDRLPLLLQSFRAGSVRSQEQPEGGAVDYLGIELAGGAVAGQDLVAGRGLEGGDDLLHGGGEQYRGGLHQGVGSIPGGEPQPLHAALGDHRHEAVAATDVEGDLGVDGAARDGQDRAMKLVARAALHFQSLHELAEIFHVETRQVGCSGSGPALGVLRHIGRSITRVVSAPVRPAGTGARRACTLATAISMPKYGFSPTR